jgi:hypothetical protein
VGWWANRWRGTWSARGWVSYSALTQLAGPPEAQDPATDTMAAVTTAILDRRPER